MPVTNQETSQNWNVQFCLAFKERLKVKKIISLYQCLDKHPIFGLSDLLLPFGGA